MLKKVLSIVTLSLFAVLFTGCFSDDFIKPGQDQIDAYVKSHPDIPELDKACIFDGRFEVGMRAETVRFLLGEPKKIEIVQQPWAKQEKWTYKHGNFKVFFIEDNGVVGITESE